MTVSLSGHPAVTQTVLHVASFEPLYHSIKKAHSVPALQRSPREKGQKASPCLVKFSHTIKLTHSVSHCQTMGHMATPKPVTTKKMDQQSLNRPGPMSESVATGPYSEQLGSMLRGQCTETICCAPKCTEVEWGEGFL